jgi:hypothetical protein
MDEVMDDDGLIAALAARDVSAGYPVEGLAREPPPGEGARHPQGPVHSVRHASHGKPAGWRSGQPAAGLSP